MNKCNGIFQCTYPEFKEKFESVTICQTIFNSTIYSYPVNFQKINNCVYFKLEVFEDTLFVITMHKKNTINYKGSIKNEVGQDDINKPNDKPNQDDTNKPNKTPEQDNTPGKNDKIKNGYTSIVIGNNVNEEIISKKRLY